MDEMRNMLKETGREAQVSYVGQLLEKWNPILKGVKNNYQRGVMAVLFENQSTYLKELTEETRTTNVGEFLKYVFPVLRRVFPNLIANEIVSVQPMTAPVGGIFYFEVKYANTKGSVTAGDKFIKDFNRFYSSETIDKETIGNANGATAAFSSTLDYTPVKFGLHDDKVQIWTTLSAVDTQVAVDDGTGTGTLVAFGGSGVSGTVNYTSGAIAVTFPSNVANNTVVWATYQYDMECNESIPQANLDITLQEVRAKTRKLKALWCSEAADDLKAFHGIDAEAELVAVLAADIALEIDREIIMDVYANAAGGTETWDYVTPPTGVSEIDHLRSIVTKISSLSNKIFKQTLRGAANFIVTSPEIGGILEQLGTHGAFRPLFAPQNSEIYSAPENPQTFGVQKIGTLQQKWVVYKDPFFPKNKMVMGYKGSSFLDAGYVWAPYVPLQVTATFLDPNDFSFRKGMRTRYAKKMARPEFYGTLTVTSMP